MTLWHNTAWCALAEHTSELLALVDRRKKIEQRLAQVLVRSTSDILYAQLRHSPRVYMGSERAPGRTYDVSLPWS